VTIREAQGILAANRIDGDRLYTLPLGQGPSSITDQVRLAKKLVQAAIHIGVFNTTGNRLLVVGAGAAGVTAAITAERNGVHTVLRERGKAPFSLQRTCQTRWIDPHEYDWPSGCWDCGKFPFDIQDFPDCVLPWEAGYAFKVAQQWTKSFSDAQKESGLHQTYGDPVDLTDRPETLARAIDPESLFGMILCCVGGQEKTWVDSNGFEGYGFWKGDSLNTASLGLAPGSQNILIAGGGDGALQDFIRIVFRLGYAGLHSVREVIKLLGLKNECSGLSNRMDRGEMWQTHTKLIETMKEDGRWKNIQKILNGRIDPLLLRGERKIHIAIRGETFSDCYCLNSLLAHVAIAHLEDLKKSPLRTKLALTSVTSADPRHVCQKEPWVCNRFKHRATLVESKTHGTAQNTLTEVFDLIIIRYGIKPTLPRVSPTSK
jgi:hypothetical protein